jgi:hypothetical protein
LQQAVPGRHELNNGGAAVVATSANMPRLSVWPGRLRQLGGVEKAVAANKN